MARSRKRPWGEPHRELDGESLRRGAARTETDRQGRSWTVRSVAGNERGYRCPGCSGEIPARTPHVVAWTTDHLFGAEAGLAERRHWHTGCWSRR